MTEAKYQTRVLRQIFSMLDIVACFQSAENISERSYGREIERARSGGRYSKKGPPTVVRKPTARVKLCSIQNFCVFLLSSMLAISIVVSM